MVGEIQVNKQAGGAEKMSNCWHCGSSDIDWKLNPETNLVEFHCLDCWALLWFCLGGNTDLEGQVGEAEDEILCELL